MEIAALDSWTGALFDSPARYTSSRDPLLLGTDAQSDVTSGSGTGEFAGVPSTSTVPAASEVSQPARAWNMWHSSDTESDAGSAHFRIGAPGSTDSLFTLNSGGFEPPSSNGGNSEPSDAWSLLSEDMRHAGGVPNGGPAVSDNRKQSALGEAALPLASLTSGVFALSEESMRQSYAKSSQDSRQGQELTVQGNEFTQQSAMQSAAFTQQSAMQTAHFQNQMSLMDNKTSQAEQYFMFTTQQMAASFTSYGMPSFLAYDPSLAAMYKPNQAVTAGKMSVTAPVAGTPANNSGPEAAGQTPTVAPAPAPTPAPAPAPTPAPAPV